MKLNNCCKFPCRENRTRTCDPSIPNAVFSLLNYFPIYLYYAKIYIFFHISKFSKNFFWVYDRIRTCEIQVPQTCAIVHSATYTMLGCYVGLEPTSSWLTTRHFTIKLKTPYKQESFQLRWCRIRTYVSW